MNRKGNYWDNAVTERFFLNLKMERVWQPLYANQAEALEDVVDYIVNLYKPVRLHSTLGYLSPNTFEHRAAQTALPQQPSALSFCPKSLDQVRAESKFIA